MSKNPFATAYTSQPPLPPGPPPMSSQPQHVQQDYSSWYTAAAQYGVANAYNPQWTASQPAQQANPSTAQPNLYVNYGYGQKHQHLPPAPPVVQPPPPPPPAQQQPQAQPQYPYNPYQPQTTYAYVPQAAAQAISYQQASPPQPIQPIQQQPAPAPPFFPLKPQHQQPRPNRQHNVPHGSPNQYPPAKRPRFDGGIQQRGHPPPPPFQPPPPPPMQQGQGGYGQGPSQSGYGQGPNQGGYGQNRGGYARGGPPQQGGRGGYNGGRGGNIGGRGRGGSMINRGTTRGRGASSYNNMGGRGSGNQIGGSFRGQGANRGFGNRDNRRGGSFSNQGYQHQPHQNYSYHHQSQSHSYRGRGQGYMHSNRGGRHDSASLGGRDNVTTASSSFSSGKKDENKRTLTDFKIIGLKIPEINWVWGLLPESVDAAVKDEVSSAPAPSDEPVVVQPSDGTSQATAAEGTSTGADTATAVVPVLDASTVKAEIEALLPPPPSRVRMYFHTPVTPDDAHPISQSSNGLALSNARKGKRKKLEDDDGDYEDGRGAPPPPPHGSLDTGSEYDGVGRDSVAPSVAETTSEGDYLMAAFGEEEGDGEGGENLHVSEVEHFLEHGDGDYGNEFVQGDGDHSMGDEDAQGSEVGLDDEHITSYNTHGPNAHTEHPLANGDGYADAPPGHHEGGAVPAASQDNSNQNSQDTIASLSPALPHDAVADVASKSAGPSADDAQNASATRSGVMPLQAMDSITSTVAETNNCAHSEISPYASTVIDGGDSAEQPDHEAATSIGDEHNPDDAASASLGGSTVTTLFGEKVPSASRLSVSYAGATKRLVIDAEVVSKLKIFRAEGRIEATVSLIIDERGGFKGIAMEGCSEESTYISLELTEQLEGDSTVPPLWKATVPSEIILIMYLDKDNPLGEPRWVKTGDVQEWLWGMFGRMSWVSGNAADGWEKRVEVVDPDPVLTIRTLLETWSSNSNDGQIVERQRFLRTHMAETDNVLEILLRLVRGERSTSFTQNTPITPSSVSGPLLSALSSGSAHAAQQTHVSLAVLAMFRLTVDYAKQAAGDKGKAEVEERVGEIIRSLPSYLIYKSLDGIFKEWIQKVEKRGGRVPT